MSDSDTLSTDQRARVSAATIASEILRSRGPAATMGVPVPTRQVVHLAEWIMTGVTPPDPTPPSMMIVGEIEGGEIPTDEGGDEPVISNRMLLELTYDQPVTRDTVQALEDSHREDEGMLRVRGRLL